MQRQPRRPLLRLGDAILERRHFRRRASVTRPCWGSAADGVAIGRAHRAAPADATVCVALCLACPCSAAALAPKRPPCLRACPCLVLSSRRPSWRSSRRSLRPDPGDPAATAATRASGFASKVMAFVYAARPSPSRQASRCDRLADLRSMRSLSLGMRGEQPVALLTVPCCAPSAS